MVMLSECESYCEFMTHANEVMKDRGGGWRNGAFSKREVSLVRQVSRPVHIDLGKIVAAHARLMSDFAGEGSARSLLNRVSMKTNPSPLVLIALLFIAPTAAHSQTVARFNPSRNLISQTGIGNDQMLAARALSALKRLNTDVLVYRSLGDFEEGGKLARVSCETFKIDLQAVTAEVEPLLSRLPQSRLKTEIRNALDSYRDGAFWWQKIDPLIDQPHVVHVSALAFSGGTRTPSDTALLANVPYTVAIHWRQAEKYLKRAEGMMNGLQNPD
jgi:hypothetical protein